MKFTNWSIDGLIRYLQEMKRLADYHYETEVSGEIDIHNGEIKEKYQDVLADANWIGD